MITEIILKEFYGKGNWNEVIEILQKHHRTSDIYTWKDMRVLNEDRTIRHENKSTRVWKDLKQETAITTIEPDKIFEIYRCEFSKDMESNYKTSQDSQ